MQPRVKLYYASTSSRVFPKTPPEIGSLNECEADVLDLTTMIPCVSVLGKLEQIFSPNKTQNQKHILANSLYLMKESKKHAFLLFRRDGEKRTVAKENMKVS